MDSLGRIPRAWGMESKANGGGTENAKTLWIKRLRTNRVFLHHGVNVKKISLSHSVDEDVDWISPTQE